jgi:hypothetical protein
LPANPAARPYLAGWSGGLRVVDISDPANPTEVGYHHTVGGAISVTATNSRAYVSCGGAGFSTFHFNGPIVATVIEVFKAAASTGRVNLSWSVKSDEPVAGFRILKKNTADGTIETLPGSGLLSPSVRSYSDQSIEAFVTYDDTLVVVRPGGTADTVQRPAQQRIPHAEGEQSPNAVALGTPDFATRLLVI